MIERVRATDALALAVRPREREYAVHDTVLQGFILRVQPNGAQSCAFRFRRDGAPRRVTLGKPDEVKANQAPPPRLPSSRVRRRQPIHSPFRLRLAAGEVRRRTCRVAHAVVETVHGKGHHELSQ